MLTKSFVESVGIIMETQWVSTCNPIYQRHVGRWGKDGGGLGTRSDIWAHPVLRLHEMYVSRLCWGRALSVRNHAMTKDNYLESVIRRSLLYILVRDPSRLALVYRLLSRNNMARRIPPGCTFQPNLLALLWTVRALYIIKASLKGKNNKRFIMHTCLSFYQNSQASQPATWKMCLGRKLSFPSSCHDEVAWDGCARPFIPSQTKLIGLLLLLAGLLFW